MAHLVDLSTVAMCAERTSKPQGIDWDKGRNRQLLGAVIILNPDNGDAIAHLTLHGPASGFRTGMERIHARLLTWKDGECYHGEGHAGGGGYCKRSAAAAAAMRAAGYTLSDEIGGCGMGVVESALLAIAKANGHARALLVTVDG